MALASNPPAEEPPAPARIDGGAESSSLGRLALGTYRPLWAAPEVEVSPALRFLIPDQTVELSLQDAERLGIADDDRVIVAQNGTRLNARAVIRSTVPAGRAFLAEGLAADSANALTESLIEVIKPSSRTNHAASEEASLDGERRPA